MIHCFILVILKFSSTKRILHPSPMHTLWLVNKLLKDNPGQGLIEKYLFLGWTAWPWSGRQTLWPVINKMVARSAPALPYPTGETRMSDLNSSCLVQLLMTSALQPNLAYQVQYICLSKVLGCNRSTLVFLKWLL